MKPKKRNRAAQDTTLINLRALNKKILKLNCAISQAYIHIGTLEAFHDDLRDRVISLENIHKDIVEPHVIKPKRGRK